MPALNSQPNLPLWRSSLQNAISCSSQYDVYERFLALNPHLKSSDKFTNRYETRKEAAVLIPVIERAEPMVLLTVRSDDMPTHAGQISFPGGVVQKDDQNHAFTALRETQEEIGINPNCVEVLGDIGAHYGGMGFKVTPYVGVVQRDAQCMACPREVQEIFEVPLSYLLNLNNHKTEDKMHDNVPYTVFTVPYKEYYIWGLTAGMLRTLAERVYALKG